MSESSLDHVVAQDSYPVTLEAIVRYAGASGDFTRIHYDPAELARAGYDHFFAMGMLVAGRLGSLATQTFGEGRIGRFHVRFRERSMVDTTVTMRILRSSEDHSFDLEARDDADVVIATGSVSVISAHCP